MEAGLRERKTAKCLQVLLIFCSDYRNTFEHTILSTCMARLLCKTSNCWICYHHCSWVAATLTTCWSFFTATGARQQRDPGLATNLLVSGVCKRLL